MARPRVSRNAGRFNKSTALAMAITDITGAPGEKGNENRASKVQAESTAALEERLEPDFFVSWSTSSTTSTTGPSSDASCPAAAAISPGPERPRSSRAARAPPQSSATRLKRPESVRWCCGKCMQLTSRYLISGLRSSSLATTDLVEEVLPVPGPPLK